MAGKDGGGAACAACKYLRRRCGPACPFAPYFPAEQPARFASVHRVFGVSNITRLLADLPLHSREDAVSSLAYEADARMKDPVYGCVGAISILQQQVLHLQAELAAARRELEHWKSGRAADAGSSPPGSSSLQSTTTRNSAAACAVSSAPAPLLAPQRLLSLDALHSC